jgi:hypothetical protein
MNHLIATATVVVALSSASAEAARLGTGNAEIITEAAIEVTGDAIEEAAARDIKAAALTALRAGTEADMGNAVLAAARSRLGTRRVLAFRFSCRQTLREGQELVAYCA